MHVYIHNVYTHVLYTYMHLCIYTHTSIICKRKLNNEQNKTSLHHHEEQITCVIHKNLV